MRIAVINETSAADRNADILAALRGRGQKVINAGCAELEPPGAAAVYPDGSDDGHPC